MRSLLAKKMFVLFMVCGGCLSAVNNDDLCSEDKLFSYFPKEFVMNTLNKYQVPKERRDSIYRNLSEKDSEIIQRVEDRASQMSPNPLQDPKERHVAVQIFRETLAEVFTNVMNMHGISDRNQIMTMLDDIQRQKAELFAMCMEKQQPQGQNGQWPDDDEEDYQWDDER